MHDSDADPFEEVFDDRRRNWLNRLSWGAMALSILAVLGMFVALSFYAHPQTDDFGEYDDVRDLGIVQTISKRYHGWTGRYTYVTLEGIAVSQMDLIDDFWLVGLCTMSALMLSIFCFMRTVTRGVLSRWSAAGLSAGLFVVYCAQLASPSRAFYWLTGAMTNQLVLILSLLAFALLLRDPTEMSKFKRAALIIGASVLMSAAIGTYDNTIPMLNGMLLGATIVALITRNPRRLQFSIVLAIALISSAVVLLAPGNAVREAHFEKAPLLQAIDYSITNSLKWMIPYILSPVVLVASLLFLPAGCRIGRRLREISNGRPRWMLLVVAMWGLMIVCSWLPAQYVMQGNPPPRTLNTTSLFLLIGVFGSIAVFCAQVPGTPPRRLPVPPGLLATGRFALAAILLTQGNGIEAFVQLKSEVQAFDNAMHERYAIIQEAKTRGELDVVVPPLPVQPTLLLPLGKDITTDPVEYPNYATCRYWEIDTIRIEEPESTVPAETP
jgi:hypothetical protein